MSAPRNLREEIINLRNDGKSYREIEKLLSCSKGTVNYHCKKFDLTDTGMKRHKVSEELKAEISEYCKTHTSAQASVHFNLCLSTIKAYRKINPKD